MKEETLKVLISKTKPYLKRWSKHIQEEMKKMFNETIEKFGWDIVTHFFLSQCEYEGLLDTVRKKLLNQGEKKKFTKDEIQKLRKVFSNSIIIAYAQVPLSPEERRLYAFIEMQLNASLTEIYNDALEEFPAMNSETVHNTILSVIKTIVKLEENEN